MQQYRPIVAWSMLVLSPASYRGTTSWARGVFLQVLEPWQRSLCSILPCSVPRKFSIVAPMTTLPRLVLCVWAVQAPHRGNNVLCVAFVSASRQTRPCRLRAHRGSTMPAPCRRRDTIMPAPCRRRDTITRMMPAPCRRRDTLHQNPLYQITVLVAGQSGSCRKVGTAMCVGSYPYLLAWVFLSFQSCCSVFVSVSLV